jgi:hypothetical protein
LEFVSIYSTSGDDPINTSAGLWPGWLRRAVVRKTTDTRLMTGPDLDPEQYPPIDPREPVPDDPGVLLPDTPDALPEAPVEPMPDDGGNAGGVREPA